MNTEFAHHLVKYISLSPEEYSTIETYFSERSLRKGLRLINAGDMVQHTYWVKKGLLVSAYNEYSGKEYIVQFAIERCWITDQNAFYNQTKATFNIQCLEDSELLAISFENREKLCREVPKMERFFRRKANDSFVKLQRRLLTYLTADAKARFDQLLDEYPGIAQRIPKKILAGYLGVSRETLSRL